MKYRRNLAKPESAVLAMATVLFFAQTLLVPSYPVEAQASPSIAVLAPAGLLDSSTTVRTSFHVTFAVFNFEVVQPGLPGQTNKANQGHLHVFLDGKYYAQWASVNPIQFNNLRAGSHKIKLELVNNDHTSLSPEVSTTITVNATDGPLGKPALAVLSPAGLFDKSTIVAPSFVVAFAYFNYTLTEPEGQPNAINTGHIHVFLDGKYRAVWASPNSIPFNDLSPGEHTITLELVNNDHTSLSPAVRASLTIQVTTAPTGTPSMVILSPSGALNKETSVGPSFIVSFALADFALSDPRGQPNAVNTGHIHVFLNGVYYNLWSSPEGIPFSNLPPGEYTIKLELVSNDHTSLSPPVSQTIKVTVKAVPPLFDLTSILNAITGATDSALNAITGARDSAASAKSAAEALRSPVDTAVTYGLGALGTSILTLIVVLYLAIGKRKQV